MVTKKNKNRFLSKLAPVREVGGESERRTTVYTQVHEDSIIESTNKFPTGVEFGKKSNTYQLVSRVAELLKQQQLMLTTAESCTGGQIAYLCTSLSGSSAWFERGFVTYSNEAKQEMLGVSAETITCFGAVSEQTAIEMAEGAIQKSHAQISVAVTGIAGPTGGGSSKPVGTIWLAWAQVNKQTKTALYHFEGDRLHIRNQACLQGLIGIIDWLVATN